MYDGSDAIVVVDRDLLLDWQTRLLGTGVQVAPSCVEPALLRVINQAVQLAEIDAGGIVSTHYDALLDAIVVTGLTRDGFDSLIQKLAPPDASAARAAIEAGTLRIGR